MSKLAIINYIHKHVVCAHCVYSGLESLTNPTEIACLRLLPSGEIRVSKEACCPEGRWVYITKEIGDDDGVEEGVINLEEGTKKDILRDAIELFGIVDLSGQCLLYEGDDTLTALFGM